MLAARSRGEAPRFGSAERQRVIDDMHARMLAIMVGRGWACVLARARVHVC